ncbi:mechanosensitive ion channel family protein [Roseibacillus persicicus]|uniref:Mechanosensitive ion channel protein MscS n=1 Tax=Roseibacillus persicicus TaxID=454148 RepID=A0A918TC38_9BACT|nr:mechanosensitive ion channel family protein [Roseibacillus persicicus]GHC41494.1 hypothetical protein GCM10007100_02840 [Roseibacillus persicicus]
MFLSLDKTYQILEGSIRESLKAAVAHLPNFVASALVLLFVAALVWVYSRLARKFLKRFELRPSLRDLVLTFGKTILWTVGLVAAATILFPGLTPSKALGAAGLASVAVGLAFKDIFQNFFAGILLLWRFPFEPGDIIEVDGVRGKVIDTRLRMTTVRSTEGELVIVPNSQLIENPLNVLTDQDFRRTVVKTGVAYKEDLGAAVEVIKETLEKCGSVRTEKPHDVFVSGFGSSSMDIDVIYWTHSRPYEMRRSRSEVAIAIKKALDEAGIEIPFPYRTLTFDEPLSTVLSREEASRTAS